MLIYSLSGWPTIILPRERILLSMAAIHFCATYDGWKNNSYSNFNVCFTILKLRTEYFAMDKPLRSLLRGDITPRDSISPYLLCGPWWWKTSSLLVLFVFCLQNPPPISDWLIYLTSNAGSHISYSVSMNYINKMITVGVRGASVWAMGMGCMGTESVLSKTGN